MSKLIDLVVLKKSADGEIYLYDSRDKFLAGYKNGGWQKGLQFQDREMDDFRLIEDESEIERALEEARAALV
ncbi:MAG TPA: hypothetical protein V6C72_00055 [Chroococcales cyanobacterium]